MAWQRKDFSIHSKLDARKEGKLSFHDRILKPRKTGRPVWWLVIMAFLVLGLYYYLMGIVRVK